MKQVLMKTLIVAAAVMSFSSCDKGGGGGNAPAATVPTIPGTPVGNVYVQGDQTNYCNFVGGNMICYSPICNSNTLTYTDLNTMCSQLTQLQQFGFGTTVTQCNVSAAAQFAYSSYCQNSGGIIGGGTLNPSNDPNFKTIQCELEGYRNSVSLPTRTATISFDGRRAQEIDLQRKFIFDIGKFGRTKMTYKPAGIKGVADTITLSNEGLARSLKFSQSGFAGQPVKMEAMSEDGSMKLAVTCTGQGVFKKNVAVKAFTQYVCRGTSSLYGSTKETIEASFPYNAGLLNSELNLAENLTATITGDTGSDNARITFTAHGVGTRVSLQSSAYLKTTSQLNGTDGYTTLNLTCGPQ